MNLTSPATPGDGGNNNGRCELLGPFAIFVQGALGALALLSLVWKRARESPQRPLLIWWFDVSKQVLGSILVHIANLLLSMFSSGAFSGLEPTPRTISPSVSHLFIRVDRSSNDDDGKYHANPCSFYLLNLLIDTTIGIFILVVILRILHRLLLLSPWPILRTGITSGEYGDPPKWSHFGKQAIIYFMGLMGMKFVVFLIFALLPWLGQFGDWLLGWTQGDKRVQVFFVMFFFPLVMNAIQYYIIDSYIKSQDPCGTVTQDSAPIDSSRHAGSNRRSFDDSEDIFSDEDDEANLLQSCRNSQDPFGDARSSPVNGNGIRKTKHPRVGVQEYDPEIDGTTVRTASPPDSASSSFLAVRTGQRRVGRRALLGGGSTAESLSSLMLLPGSRGPSTPGYRDDDTESREMGSGMAVSIDDETTLVGKESSSERDVLR